MKFRPRRAGRLLGFCLLVAIIVVSPAHAQRVLTLDDALSLRSVGNVSASSNNFAAIESGGSIKIFSIATRMGIHELAGSNSSWAPNGRLLAYLSPTERGVQVFVWDSRENRTRQVSNVDGGISASEIILGRLGCEDTISWSRDSTRIAFVTRHTPRVSERPSAQIRVFNTSPVRWEILEGVFATPDFWSTMRFLGPDTTSRNRATDRDPESDITRIVVVNVMTGAASTISDDTARRYCPVWSPQDDRIAAIVDRSEGYPVTYSTTGLSVTRSGLSIINVRSRREQLIDLPANRVGQPSWSPEGGEIAVLAERRPIPGSFSEIMIYSTTTGHASFVPVPDRVGVEKVQWSRYSRSLLAVLHQPFVNTLWRIDPTLGHTRQLSAERAYVRQFDEFPDGQILLNSEGGRSYGHVTIVNHDLSESILFEANPQLQTLPLGEQRRVSWTNRAGEPAEGILILPENYDHTKRYPVIVNTYPLSGRDQFWFYPSYETPGHLQASWGYVVFIPNLRAPHAALRYPHGEQATEDARGARGIDTLLDDFESGIDHLNTLGIIDPRRIGLFGHSNGGWAANFIMTRSRYPRAAIIASGVSNAISLSFFPVPMAPQGVDPATGGNVFDNFEEYRQLSPIFMMRGVRIPTLLTVGDDDWFYVPQILSEYGVLRESGAPAELVRYGGEGHILQRRESIEDALTRMRRFYDENL